MKATIKDIKKEKHSLSEKWTVTLDVACNSKQAAELLLKSDENQEIEIKIGDVECQSTQKCPQGAGEESLQEKEA